MGQPDTACIAFRISQTEYKSLFEEVWGKGSLDINFPSNAEQICSTPGGGGGIRRERHATSAEPGRPHRGEQCLRSLGAVDLLLRSFTVSQRLLVEVRRLPGEQVHTDSRRKAGYNLFRGKAGCYTCHLDGRGTTQTPGTGSDKNPSTTTGTDTGSPADVAPVFTCFGSANLGLPLNPVMRSIIRPGRTSTVLPPNPLGFLYRDLGLGTFLRSGFGSAPNPNADWISLAPSIDGQMQVSSARNVAMTPPQCPTTEAPGP